MSRWRSLARRFGWMVLLAPCAVCPRAGAGQEPGLASKYPGDAGIERDPNVLFAEDFEAGHLKKWDDRDDNSAPKVQLLTGAGRAHAGRRAVRLEAQPGRGAGGDLTKILKTPCDRVFARWYCRFASDFDQGPHMHFVHLAALRERRHLGRSGQKPDGTDFFCTGLDPWSKGGRYLAPGALGFYSYFVDMKRDPAGPYWGNAFRPDKPPVLVPRGRWVCMEMMLQANHPSRADGEQAFWVDGKLKGHYRNIRWRTTDRLKINCFWLLLYIHRNGQVNRVDFDDIVVARRYIGPMRRPGPGKERP